MDHKLDELRQPAPVIDHRAGVNATIERLQTQVSAIGIEHDVRLALGNNIQKGDDRFNLSLEAESGGDKLGVKLHFIKEGSDFKFPGYEATLLHHKPVAYGQINGVDTKELDYRMKNADWYYGIAESEEMVLNGFKDTEAIEADLRQLSGYKQGAVVAAQLWNNHVPVNTVAKPDFIAGSEAAADLYPKRSFPADMKIGEARDILKTEHQEQQLSQERISNRLEFAFYESEPGEIKQHLQQLQADGNKYVAYIEDVVPTGKADLEGCKNTFEAMQYVYENSNGVDRCTFSTIQHMTNVVERWERLSEADVNIAAIEQKMSTADWNYNKVSLTREHWATSEAKMVDIHKDLVLLSKLPGGMEKANALWDKYAPPGTLSKPYFLSANPGQSAGLGQGQDGLTSGQQIKDSKHLTAASQNNQPVSKVEAPAKEGKHKHRRRLQ